MSPPTRVSGGWSVRVRYGADLRGRFRMPDMPEPEANERARRLERMARLLSDAGLHPEARVLLSDAASQRSAKRFAETEAKAAQVAAEAGEARPLKIKTFRDVCELLWSGELHRMAPDRVALGTTRSRAQARARLELICQSIGDVPITRVTLDTAERALAALPKTLMKSTRRQYAQRIIRIMRLAALPPLRLIESSPIPSGWAPTNGPRRAFPFLYPEEDKQLLRSGAVDIEHRYVWGFLAREGCRISEALALKWSDIDLERGVIRLDKNKSRSPRTWRIGQDVSRALHELRRRRGDGEGDRVFHVAFDEKTSASAFRADLRLAGVNRHELFERTAERSPIRAHDLRGSFVTLALAAGKNEAWVMDRTGHTTSGMLNRYRRQARFAEELGLGWFDPLDQLLGLGRGRASGGGSGSKNQRSRKSATTPKSGAAAELPGYSAQEGAQSRVSTCAGPATSEALGHIEQLLADSLRAASAAGEWEAVAQLARELGERRRSREGSR